MPLGKDHRIARMSKAELSETGSKVLFSITGGGQVGCLACNKRQVVSLFGASVLNDQRRLQN